jgi:hypothetical protein
VASVAEVAQQSVAVAMAAGDRTGSGAFADGCEETAQWHHISTVQNSKSPLRGVPWMPRYKKLFDKAGLSMENAANKVLIRGHQGPHPEEYHRIVFSRLSDAMEDCGNMVECREALKGVLKMLADEVSKSGTRLNELVTRGCR